MSDPLRPLWDFDDLDATEARFRALRAEALTQLARVEGLRGRFEEGDRLLDEIADDDPRVRIRVDLERGRLRRSSGDKQAALPLFESAYARALDAGEDWLAGDAAHMCALAAPDRDGFVAWTSRGIELAESSRCRVVLARAAAEQPRLGALRRRRACGGARGLRTSARSAGARPREPWRDRARPGCRRGGAQGARGALGRAAARSARRRRTGRSPTDTARRRRSHARRAGDPRP